MHLVEDQMLCPNLDNNDSLLRAYIFHVPEHEVPSSVLYNRVNCSSPLVLKDGSLVGSKLEI